MSEHVPPNETVVNDKPGKCQKCNGTGVFNATKGWACNACQGKGNQTQRDISRNLRYAEFKRHGTVPA